MSQTLQNSYSKTHVFTNLLLPIDYHLQTKTASIQRQFTAGIIFALLFDNFIPNTVLIS